MSFFCLSRPWKRNKRRKQSKPRRKHAPQRPSNRANVVGKDGIIDREAATEEESSDDQISLRNTPSHADHSPLPKDARASSDPKHEHVPTSAEPTKPDIRVEDPTGMVTVPSIAKTQTSGADAEGSASLTPLASPSVSTGGSHVAGSHHAQKHTIAPDLTTILQTSPPVLRDQESATQSRFQSVSRLSRSLSQKQADEARRKEDIDSLIDSLIKPIRQDILKNLQNPSQNVKDLLEHPDTFINNKALRKILTRERLTEIFDLLPGDWHKWIEPLYAQFTRIIATLVLVGWRCWDKFYELFYSQHKQGSRLDDARLDFMRCDMQMPFIERSDLTFLNDVTTEQAFYSRQFIFTPAVLVESNGNENESCNAVEAPVRLPFRSKIHCKDGESRQVYRVTVEKFGMRTRNRSEELEPNTSPVPYAMKVFKKAAPFYDERRVHQEFKRADFTLKHVVVSVTTFRRGEDFCSLIPWADVDLLDLLLGKCSLDGMSLDYGSPDRSRFTPHSVLLQLKGIMSALDFLHDKHGMVHLDIKPDNILVYALSIGDCGVWKLNDFGLSQLRKPELHVVSGPVDERERSSVPAPRQPGTYQPPEMRDGQTVNRLSDMFSIGAVMFVCWAFVIGGPQAVKDSSNARRHGHKDDLFFHRNGSHFELKPELEQWRQSTSMQNAAVSSQWSRSLLECISKLLNVERSQRPEAKATKGQLDRIVSEASGHKQPWMLESNTETIATENFFEHTMSAHDVPILAHRDLKAVRTSAGRYITLGPCPNEFDAQLSSQWVVYVAPDQARVYSLDTLLKLPNLWQDQHNQTPLLRRAGDNASQLLRSHHRIERASVAGDYLILILMIEAERKKVEVRNLKQKSARVHDLPPNYLKIIVSSQGVLAFVLQDKIVAILQNGLAEEIEFDSNSEQIKEVAFSHDGNYLCVWAWDPLESCMIWRVFRYREVSSLVERGKSMVGDLSTDAKSFKFIGWRYSAKNLVLPKDKKYILRSTTRGQSFFACESDGRFWFINCEDCERVDLQESWPEDIKAMQHKSGNIDLTIPLLHDALIVLQKDQQHAAVRLWAFLRKPGLDDNRHHRVKVLPNWNYWASDSPHEIANAHMVEFCGAEGLLIVYRTGVLELRLLLDE